MARTISAVFAQHHSGKKALRCGILMSAEWFLNFNLMSSGCCCCRAAMGSCCMWIAKSNETPAPPTFPASKAPLIPIALSAFMALEMKSRRSVEQKSGCKPARMEIHCCSNIFALDLLPARKQLSTHRLEWRIIMHDAAQKVDAAERNFNFSKQKANCRLTRDAVMIYNLSQPSEHFGHCNWQNSHRRCHRLNFDFILCWVMNFNRLLNRKTLKCHWKVIRRRTGNDAKIGSDKNDEFSTLKLCNLQQLRKSFLSF